MKKIANILLAMSILAASTACGSNKQANPAPSTSPQASPSAAATGSPTGGPPMLDPTQVSQIARDMIPKLQNDLKKMLIDNASQLWPNFNNNDLQILLVSPSNKTAYLINNQKAENGPKDKVIEYSTDSLGDVGLIVRPFQLTKYNGYSTYVVNVDTMLPSNSIGPNGLLGPDERYEKMFKFIIHESVHLLLQAGQQTGEGASRSETYPEDINSRYNRNEMYQYLKEAELSANKDDKIGNIQKAAYYYDLFINANTNNKSQYMLDNTEGLAKYLENKAYVLLSHPNASASEINNLVAQKIIDDFAPVQPGKAILAKPNEPYNIGALGIACAIGLGLDNSEIFKASPLELLKSKYGSKQAEGHANIKQQIDDFYNTYNNDLKSYVDEITAKINNPEYAAVKIPITPKNGGGSFSKFIQYQYQGKPAEIQGISRDIILGDLRIKMNQLKVINVPAASPAAPVQKIEQGQKVDGQKADPGQMKMPGDDTIISYNIIYVPKKDIQVKDNLLTIQRDDLMVFDAKFELKDGQYEILSK